MHETNPNPKVFWAVMLAIALTPVFAMATCLPTTNCTIMSPSLDCPGTYNATILNSTNVQERTNLTLVNDSIYSLLVSLPSGEYTIKYCDNQTSTLTIAGGDEMTSLAILLFFMTLSAGPIIASYQDPTKYAFSKSQYLDAQIRRGLRILGLFTLLMTTTIAGQLAAQAGIIITGEINTLISILGIAISTAIIFTAIMLFLDSINHYKEVKIAKKYGNYDKVWSE